MLAAVVVAVLLGCAAVGATVAWRRESGRAELARTDAEGQRARADAIGAELAVTADALDRARAERDDEARRADATAAELTGARAAAGELHALLSAVTAERDEARRQGAAGVAPLWPLEVLRARRRWVEAVSAPGVESPLDDRAACRQVVEVLLEAAREESGTPFVLDWALAAEPDGAIAVWVTRIVEELAAAARPFGGGAVRVGDDGHGVVVELIVDATAEEAAAAGGVAGAVAAAAATGPVGVLVAQAPAMPDPREPIT